MIVAIQDELPSGPDVRFLPLDAGAAFALHQAGRYADAARVYDAHLRHDPDDAVVLHLFGTLHQQCGHPARSKATTGKSKVRRMQEAFAAYLRHVARLYPVGAHKRVVLILDNAPWHRGKLIDEVLAEHAHLEFYRLLSYSPQLNVIERFWKQLRRRATHNRLFDILAALKRSLRVSLCYYQTMRGRVRGLIHGCYARPGNQTASAGV